MLIFTLKEKLEAMGLTGAPGFPSSLTGVDLHPAIKQACGRLSSDGHYTSAVENACKALNSLVQSKSGMYDKDNTNLMFRVFSKNNPKVAL